MKEKILFVGYSGITLKHIKFLDKKKYDFYLISNHFKNKNFFNLIDLKKAKNLFFKFIFICSPANNKIYYLNELIDNSKKFFLEKPISSSLENFNKFTFSPTQKKKIYVGYVFRHNNIIKKFKNTISKNKKNGKLLGVQIISRSYLPEWRKHINYLRSVSSIKKKGGGVILELSHEIDLVLYLFGNFKVIKSLLTNSNTLKTNVEERADILIRTSKLEPINILLDFNSRLIERKIIVNFSNINYVINLKNNYIEIIDKFKNNKLIKFRNADKHMFKNQIDFFLKKNFFTNSFKESEYILKKIDEIKKIK